MVGRSLASVILLMLAGCVFPGTVTDAMAACGGRADAWPPPTPEADNLTMTRVVSARDVQISEVQVFNGSLVWVAKSHGDADERTWRVGALCAWGLGGGPFELVDARAQEDVFPVAGPDGVWYGVRVDREPDHWTYALHRWSPEQGTVAIDLPSQPGYPIAVGDDWLTIRDRRFTGSSEVFWTSEAVVIDRNTGSEFFRLPSLSLQTENPDRYALRFFGHGSTVVYSMHACAPDTTGETCQHGDLPCTFHERAVRSGEDHVVWSSAGRGCGFVPLINHEAVLTRGGDDTYAVRRADGEVFELAAADHVGLDGSHVVRLVVQTRDEAGRPQGHDYALMVLDVKTETERQWNVEIPGWVARMGVSNGLVHVVVQEWSTSYYEPGRASIFVAAVPPVD